MHPISAIYIYIYHGLLRKAHAGLSVYRHCAKNALCFRKCFLQNIFGGDGQLCFIRSLIFQQSSPLHIFRDICPLTVALKTIYVFIRRCYHDVVFMFFWYFNPAISETSRCHLDEMPTLLFCSVRLRRWLPSWVISAQPGWFVPKVLTPRWHKVFGKKNSIMYVWFHTSSIEILEQKCDE